jgi:hypothetical protein
MVGKEKMRMQMRLRDGSEMVQISVSAKRKI